MKTKILKIVLFVFSLVSALIAWSRLGHESLGAVSKWTIPSLWFSLYFIFLILFFAAEKRKWPSLLLIVLSLGTSLIWAPTFLHLLFVLAGAILSLAGLYLVHKDFDLSLKIDLVKSLKFGKAFLVLAIVVVISGQFFHRLEAQDSERVMENLKIGDVLGNDVSKKLMTVFIPNLENLDENSTVDESILKNYESQKSLIPDDLSLNISEEQQKVLYELEKDKFLEAGREQIGSMLGREVKGDEKIGKILAEIVNNKVNQVVSPEFRQKNSRSLAGMWSGLLFLVIWPLASILAWFLIILASFVFLILKKTKLISIEKAMAEKEVIGS